MKSPFSIVDEILSVTNLLYTFWNMTMSQYLKKSMHIMLKYRGNYNPGQKGLGHFFYPLPFLVESW